MNISRIGLAVAASPAAAMLIVYYSLAIHMHHTLGGWPTSIGERGFPPSLVLHSAIDMYLYIALVWSIIFILPAALIICSGIRR